MSVDRRHTVPDSAGYLFYLIGGKVLNNIVCFVAHGGEIHPYFSSPLAADDDGRDEVTSTF